MSPLLGVFVEQVKKGERKMKKILLTSLASLFVVSAANANVYVSEKLYYGLARAYDLSVDVPTIGITDGTNETGNAFGSKTAVGYDFGKQGDNKIRAELEFGFGTDSKFTTTNTHPDPRVNGAKLDASVNTLTLVANAYYDFATATDFTPYVGAGLGYGHVSVETTPQDADPIKDTAKIKGDNFIWNLGAGVAYNIDANWSVDLGYRWTNYGNFSGRTIENDNELKGSLQDHEILLGARYLF
jgi:outer membrane autotransporter protein